MDEYKNIPSEVRKFIKDIIVKKTSHRLSQSLEDNYGLVMRSMDTSFKKASAITGLPPEEIIKRSDFRKKDLDSDRFDAMLAEIRTIVHLDNLGFLEIQPLKAPGKSKEAEKPKEADLLGNWKGKKWAIEVICSSYRLKRWKHNEVANYIKSRLVNDGKCEQLHITAGKYNCSYKLLVIVMNSPDGKALNDRIDYLNLLKDVWVYLGKRKDLFLSVVTGMETLGSGLDNCVHPPLPL